MSGAPSENARSETPRRGGAPLRYGLMIPAGLYVLAEAAPNSTGSELLHVGAGLVVAFAVLGGIALFLFRGFWAKNIEPLILNVVTAWWGHVDQARARDTDVEKTVKAWYSAPEMAAHIDARIDARIDNQIRRDDGLIHREIRAKLDDGMEPIHETLAELRRASKERDDEDRRFRQEVITTLAQIQGAMSVGSGPFRSATLSRGAQPQPQPPPPPTPHKKL